MLVSIFHLFLGVPTASAKMPVSPSNNGLPRCAPPRSQKGAIHPHNPSWTRLKHLPAMLPEDLFFSPKAEANSVMLKPKMKMSPYSSNLPNYFTALRFICQCFGIQEKDLGHTLERLRENTPKPNKYFPQELSRMMLARAENGTGRWCDALVVVGHESLYDRIRRQHGKPLFSSTGSLAERLVFSMLKLYEKALPKLRTHGVEKEDALWILVEHLFVPTAFVILVHDWRDGLGSEFQGENCWYLPTVSSEGKMKPIPRVLDCWLRVAGFRTAYGVSEEMGSKNLRREVDRWLAGTVVPTQETLHRLAERFAKNVCWLDHPDRWKTRFTLACAMQKLCGKMESIFNDFPKDSSFALGQMFRRIAEERIGCDENKILAQHRTFFAARLLQRRLQRDGNWDGQVLAPMPKEGMPQSVPPEASDEEIDHFRQQAEWQLNAGNWFLAFIKEQFAVHSPGGSRRILLEDYIFDLGVQELNQIMDERRAGGRKARRP
jgi:hypothetical protein